MSWTALVPIKAPAAGKTRLAGSLPAEEREHLSDFMQRHVLNVLSQTPGIARVAVLSAQRPCFWNGLWIADEGAGLNAELTSAAKILGGKRIVIVHADLPMLMVEDVAILIAAGEYGAAIAPDRHHSGTNALALLHADDITLAFGPGSFRRHRNVFQGNARIVERPHLAHDIDTPDDLACATLPGNVRINR